MFKISFGANMRGITLIEVLVTSIISVIVMSGTTLFFRQSMQLNRQIYLQTTAQSLVSIASRQIDTDVKLGATVSAPAPYNTLQIFSSTNQVNPIKTYTIDANNQLMVSSPGVAAHKVIPSHDVSFAGSFMDLYESRYARIKLKATVIDNNTTCGTDTLGFLSRCRNKVAY